MLKSNHGIFDASLEKKHVFSVFSPEIETSVHNFYFNSRNHYCEENTCFLFFNVYFLEDFFPYATIK